ncbi:MAG: hypothetical protein OXF27_21090 [Acidobacteria bacterium]|nr:hypothetical protein [Acidobacteriota bacterium]
MTLTLLTDDSTMPFEDRLSEFLAELFDAIISKAEFLDRFVDIPGVAGSASVEEDLLRVSEVITGTAELGLEFLRGEISED